MAQKSSSFVYQWWIPKAELEEDLPTAFLLRQMGKKDFDIFRYKQQMSAMVPMVLKALQGADDPEDTVADLQSVVEAARAEDGFDASLYARCIKEIRNVYFKGEFVEVLDKPKDIVEWLAGLEDQDTSEELDEVLWRRSTLTEFETANFTPTSGYSAVCRTADGDQTSE
jgi:hypothetical protein